jgi:hypothetical protein
MSMSQETTERLSLEGFSSCFMLVSAAIFYDAVTKAITIIVNGS